MELVLARPLLHTGHQGEAREGLQLEPPRVYREAERTWNRSSEDIVTVLRALFKLFATVPRIVVAGWCCPREIASSGGLCEVRCWCFVQSWSFFNGLISDLWRWTCRLSYLMFFCASMHLGDATTEERHDAFCPRRKAPLPSWPQKDHFLCQLGANSVAFGTWQRSAGGAWGPCLVALPRSGCGGWRLSPTQGSPLSGFFVRTAEEFCNFQQMCLAESWRTWQASEDDELAPVRLPVCWDMLGFCGELNQSLALNHLKCTNNQVDFRSTTCRCDGILWALSYHPVMELEVLLSLGATPQLFALVKLEAEIKHV